MPATEEQLNGAALVILELRKSFADVVAVNGLNLKVERGECFGLLGPNGAGKTTTIEICEGLISPVAGPKGAAARLGVKRTTLMGKMRRLRLSRPLSEMREFPAC